MSQHSHPHATGQVLRYSVIATLGYVILTVVTGIRAHSLPLLSESVDKVTDLLALMLEWVAMFVQSLPPNATKAFGYHRAGVLAAFLNALTLVIVALYIFYEAIERLHSPVQVQPKLMIWVAAVGVVMN